MPDNHFTIMVRKMGSIFAMVMLGGMAIAQSPAGAKPEDTPGTRAAAMAEGAAGDLATLPPKPPGKSTVIGGAIYQVDPVHDQFVLKVFGGHSMKILFDERTQVYHDGIKTPLRDLHAEDHASVETVLDGTTVFALSIHSLSKSPEGECQGQIVSYDPTTRQLVVNDSVGRGPITLTVPASVAVVRPGKTESAATPIAPGDLVTGTLIAAKFATDHPGQAVASQITILATPGSTFQFSGNISFLDVSANLLALVDPRDGNSYKISFDPSRFPVSRDLHEGTPVTVTAAFDGTRYTATAIAVR